MVGGVIVGGAAIAGILYAVTKKSSGATTTQPPTSTKLPSSTKGQPAQTNTKGTIDQATLDKLLEDTVSTRSGPDYGFDLIVGGWIIYRDPKVAFTNLGKGSIVRLKMYPDERPDLATTYAAEIVEVVPLTGFTIYKGKWINTPGGLDPTALVAFTSSEISSVVKSVPRS